ncbi:MAG: molybdopterin molybdenumtransferase MoeA [Anaerolineaceae bacterium]|nr:molybdopterin molybdenumtransferase MoeA [Anaerolineaceae bacterium]
MTDLLSVEIALAHILDAVNPLPREPLSLTEALGRVLAEDIVSDINIPPFANSSMDGYAVRAADLAGATQQAPARLQVVMDIPAGSSPDQTLMPGQAARIMTGAPMPEGADAVIPVEQTDTNWRAGEDIALADHVSIYRSLQSGDYVRPAGEDIHTGQTVLQAGTTLRPQDLGVLAALGQAQITVIRQPRVAIVSTGDELVDVSEPLAPGKIRDTNSHTLAGLIHNIGGIPLRLPIARDTLDAVRGMFRDALDQQPDLIISTAGVSVGTFDVVRTVLNELGKVEFWRVNVRPGKPLAFGQVQGVPFFGLPGNPVSAMVTFDIFVRAALFKMLSKTDDAETVMAQTSEDIKSDGRRSYLRVQLHHENGQLIARTTGTQSSGALMSMVLADGLLIVPEDQVMVPAGTQLPVRLLR